MNMIVQQTLHVDKNEDSRCTENFSSSNLSAFTFFFVQFFFTQLVERVNRRSVRS